MSALAGRAREQAIELIEGFYPRGRCEFVGEFAQHLPIGIFMRMVDLPVEDREKLLAWADQQVRPSSEAEREQSYMNIFGYAAQKVKERRENPGPDAISQLTKAQVDGRPITDEEVIPMVALVLIGGLDTVASAMGFAARFLATSPAHRRSSSNTRIASRRRWRNCCAASRSSIKAAWCARTCSTRASR